MVNVFILHLNAILSAQFMCDQHVCKLPSEIVQSAWIVLDTLQKTLFQQAIKEGIKKKELTKHFDTQHMHPLPRWMALSVANYQDTILRGIAIAEEYATRYGKRHASLSELRWLAEHPISLEGPVWNAWIHRERQGLDSKKKRYEDWFLNYAYYQDVEPKTYVWDKQLDRLTHFPQIMDDAAYPGCRTLHDPVAAGQKQYKMKAGGALGNKPMKQLMRYFYRPPPYWLIESGVILQTKPKARIRKTIKKIKK